MEVEAGTAASDHAGKTGTRLTLLHEIAKRQDNIYFKRPGFRHCYLNTQNSRP